MKQFLFQPNCRIDGRSKLWPQICHIWGKQQNGCTLPRPSIFGPHELVPIFGPHELVPIFGPHELVPIFGPYESITIFGPYFRNIFSILFLIWNLCGLHEGFWLLAQVNDLSDITFVGILISKISKFEGKMNFKGILVKFLLTNRAIKQFIS